MCLVTCAYPSEVGRQQQVMIVAAELEVSFWGQNLKILLHAAWFSLMMAGRDDF